MMFCMDCNKLIEHCRCAIYEEERNFWLPQEPKSKPCDSAVSEAPGQMNTTDPAPQTQPPTK